MNNKISFVGHGFFNFFLKLPMFFFNILYGSFQFFQSLEFFFTYQGFLIFFKKIYICFFRFFEFCYLFENYLFTIEYFFVAYRHFHKKH
jgi:hypothetical protein